MTQWSRDRRRAWPPFRPKAVRNLSENNRWPELLLGSVIGWFDVAAPHEDEQLIAGIDDDGIAQMATLGVGWLELEQPVELALKFARVFLYCAIGEIGPTAADLTGALQELLEGGANTVSPSSIAYWASGMR